MIVIRDHPCTYDSTAQKTQKLTNNEQQVAEYQQYADAQIGDEEEV